MDIIKVIAGELNLKEEQVKKTIVLLDEGNTIPFIARYRKEATGELDETVLRDLEERLEYLRNLEKRKTEVVRLIEEQGKLTPELQQKIEAAVKLQEVEDLYRPYKQKRRTRATIAKEKGLEPLALLILKQEVEEPFKLAEEYVNPESGVDSVEDAINGALDIIAEQISDDADIRKLVREKTFNLADIVANGKKEKRSPYEMYYNYRETVRGIPPHRVLALNRGEKEEFLSVKIELEDDKIIPYIENKVLAAAGACNDLIKRAAADSYSRLIAPSVEREIRSEVTAKAEEQAIKVFASNLNQLLLQQPVRNHIILGLDPGYRTGCKWAVIARTGKLQEVGVIYPHPPQSKKEEAKNTLFQAIQKNNVDIVAVGNGTASRETEELVAELIKEKELGLQYIIVSEAGASVYSASKIAKEEFPDFDLSLRSAVSIARRLQDPLAELVKIDPKSIGVGQYQHDVQPKALENSLVGVVESCVNSVGVDINTASSSILKYVAGLNVSVARNIINYRDKNGEFRNREDLKKVSRLGEQTFIQCAGFIRIPDGDNELENTPVHPESYQLAEKILEAAGFRTSDLRNRSQEIRAVLEKLKAEEIAARFEAGVPTVRDILEALKKPGRDPREDLPKPLFRQDVTKIEDLKEGMVLEGTVRNVVDFGVFVDIGLKHDGLVHISQLSNKFVKHPMEVVAVGDIVKVRVIGVEVERARVNLSMKEI